MKLKNKIAAALIFSFFSSNSFAGCDFSKDVLENQDGSYRYSKECHIEVGKRVKELDLRRAQVEELKKVIELKDLALAKQDERVKLWMDTSHDLNDKLIKYDSTAKTSNTLSFVGGIAVTILSVWAAGQLINR